MNSVRPEPRAPIQLPPRYVGNDAAQDKLGFADEIGGCSDVRTLAGGAKQADGRPDAEYQIVGKGLIVTYTHN